MILLLDLAKEAALLVREAASAAQSVYHRLDIWPHNPADNEIFQKGVTDMRVHRPFFKAEGSVRTSIRPTLTLLLLRRASV
jgi:hypothetical protein